MKESELKQLQEVQTEILSMIDSFCAENEIEYSVYAGTMLGAVRHQGFIPWDDDTDICLERTHYERFIDLWNEAGVDGYYLQSTRPEVKTAINHSKVRKNNTVFISDGRPDVVDHHGIWIDVFALDKVPKDSKLRKRLMFFAKVRLVYTRGYPVVGKGKGLKLLSKIMLLLPKKLKKSIRDYADRYVMQYKDMEDGYDLVCLASPDTLRMVLPAATMKKFHRVPFEDTVVSISDEYDFMLRSEYGDYMQLPPENERVCGHNPKKIIFDTSEELESNTNA